MGCSGREIPEVCRRSIKNKGGKSWRIKIIVKKTLIGIK